MVSNTQNTRAAIAAAVAKKTENAVSTTFIINRQSIRILSTKSSSRAQTSLSLNNILIARIFFVTSSTKHNHIIIETDSLKAAEKLMYETLQKLMIMFQKAEKSEKGQISVKIIIIHIIDFKLEKTHTEIKKTREVKSNNNTTITDRMKTMKKNIKTIIKAVTFMMKSKT